MLLLDKIIFWSQKLKNKFISPKIALNYGNKNFLILDKIFLSVLIIDKNF